MGISSNPEYEALITGAFTATSQTLDVATSNQGTTTVQIVGTWSGSIVLEVSNDNSTWVIKSLANVNTLVLASSMTANGVYACNTNGFANLRLRATLISSGTANIYVSGSDSVGIEEFENIGQKTMTQSLPVVIASDQSAVPVSQSGTWNITNISGTVSLPTGASTSANQSTEITSLQLIDDVVHSQNDALNKGIPVMGQLDDTGTTAATENSVAVARITAQRAIHTNLRNNAGTEIGSTASPVGVRISDGTDTGGVTTNGDQKVVDGLRNGGVYGALNIPTANTPVEAKVGGARLANRKALIITIGNAGVFWGLDNAVTITTGQTTSNGQVLSFAIDPDSTFQVWLVGSANNKNVTLVEIP